MHTHRDRETGAIEYLHLEIDLEFASKAIDHCQSLQLKQLAAASVVACANGSSSSSSSSTEHTHGTTTTSTERESSVCIPRLDLIDAMSLT
jgi:hypothetical protein